MKSSKKIVKKAPEADDILYDKTCINACCLKSSVFKQGWQKLEDNMYKSKRIAGHYVKNDLDFSYVAMRSFQQGYKMNSSLDGHMERMQAFLEEAQEDYEISDGTKKISWRHNRELRDKKEEIDKVGDTEFYRTNFMEALDANLLVLTDNNRYQKAQGMLAPLFNGENPLLKVDELPDYLLNRLANHALRCQSNNENFPFDTQMQFIEGYAPASAKQRFDDSAQFAETMLQKAIIQNGRERPSSATTLATSYNLRSALFMRKAEVETLRGNPDAAERNKNDALLNAQYALRHAPDQAPFLLRQSRTTFMMAGGDTGTLKTALTQVNG